MRYFILKIIYFFLPLLLVIIVADLLISKKFKNSHESPGEIEVWNDIYNGKINADIAVYGSSRAWVHISPNILKDTLDLETYNFGIDGHNFWLQYLRHKEYLKNNITPKYIILCIDAFSLQKRPDLYELNQFLPFMLWNKNIIDYTSSYEGFTFKDYYLPFFRYYGNIRNIRKSIQFDQTVSKPVNYREKGYKGMDRVWNKDLSKAKKDRPNYIAKLDSNSIQLFNKFLSETKDNNIEVVLVYAPEFIEGQNFVKNRSDIMEMFDFFANKYDLHFLDYSTDSLSTKKELFYNSSHLNIKGSELFSSKLSSDLKEFIHDKNYR